MRVPGHARYAITPTDLPVSPSCDITGSIYDTSVGTIAPHIEWTSDTAEGATVLSLTRLSSIRSFVLRFFSR